MPTLILRGCKKDGSSRNGYKYPLEVGATGTCPDWQPTAECGRGLHGFLHGVGDFSSCEFSPVDDLWMAVEPGVDVIDLGGKVKFKDYTVRFFGTLSDAAAFIEASDADAKGKAVIGLVTTGGDRSTIAGGDGSTITGGYGSTITGGYGSTITGGYGSTITGGDGSTITGGDGSTITGGDGSTITGGYGSTITGGDGSTITGGDGSTITGGYGSTITGGDGSTITGGYGSTITGGDRSTLMVQRWDTKGNRYRVSVAYVGEDGILPDVAYQLDSDGKFVPVAKS